MSDAPATIRLDKWLWQARFFKTRSLATRVISEGKVRVDSVPVSKPSRAIAEGAVLTFAQGDRVRVVRVLGLGARRGPASEAQALYDDMTPAEPERDKQPHNPGYDGKGRPDRRDRENRQAFLRDIGSSPLAKGPGLD